MNKVKFIDGNIIYQGPTDLAEFGLVKFVLTDKNNTENRSSKVLYSIL
jgi:hypothetical protein